eukprot:TRINITY_DN10220_c1_g1_i1.p1 TRINITY_DN10220_c1_g1~~TRINITY_DN10220_c1_g1_i1.p1  ORF type:complete len:297 (+),score=60.80 TRINITY_DN10220_c1_g1_i1:63-953(+)
MILLEIWSRIVEETLLSRFQSPKPEGVEVVAADFDGILYHISNLNQDKGKILVSISVKFFAEMKDLRTLEFLEKEYKGYVTDVESGYNFSLLFDVENLPEDKVALARSAALLKRNCFASIFNKYFECQRTGDLGQKRAIIPYRDNETMYVTADKDRVTAIFSTTFQDEDDIILSKIFMQAFTEGRKIHGAPSVLFTHREPPLELQGTKVATGDNIGYITFVLFPRHFEFKVRDHTINMIHTFRNYLHYHIKCSKAYLHSRMRARTSEFLKVMNRAKPEPPKKAEKKTISGRSIQHF